MEEGLIQLVIWAALGLVCALLAHSKGRSPIGWFFVGVLAPCLGVILLLVLPDLKKEAERRTRMEQQNRRLRERIAKDRQVADQRYAEANRRLSAHDRALGVDTGGELEGGGAAAGALAAPPPAPPRRDGGADEAPGWVWAEWHYVVDSEDAGPVPFDELKRLWRAGAIGATTLVWTSTLDEWKKLGEVERLEEWLRG